MKRKVYLDTNIISYLTAKPSNDILILARQRLTVDWWENYSGNYSLFISELVVQEAARGDSAAAGKRLKYLSGIKSLEISNEVERVFRVYIECLGLPRKALRDALHLAIASVNKIDFVVTWNFTHLANGETIRRLWETNLSLGIFAPAIVTPEELGERG
jgi:predicted nucleic acid-binding protein